MNQPIWSSIVFRTIYEFCLNYGLDLTTDWIPVAPAAHYMMGGVKTDLHGETNIARLFACGEVSSTGVHGANRLGKQLLIRGDRIRTAVSSSELMSFGACRIHAGIPAIDTMERSSPPMQAVVEKRLKLQKIMVRYAGLRRDAQGLEQRA